MDKENKKKAGYEYLLAYKISVVLYDLTVEFCKRCQSSKYLEFKPLSSTRTYDQMVQAARSGNTNVPEGNQQGSLEGYIKLTGVSFASLEELLKDYLTYARQNEIPLWDKDQCNREIKELRQIWAILKESPTLPDSPNFPDLPNSLVHSLNLLIALTNQAIYLQKKLKISLEEKFIHEGGFRENLFKRRMEFKKNQK